jgi:CRP-like cAMP-binding protein
MFQHKEPQAFSKNQILVSLSREEQDQLRSYQETVRLTKGKVLYDAGDAIRHLYFPMGGMVSLLSTTRDGASIEVGMIGNEGVAGLPVLLGINMAPYRAMVQIPGNAIRIRADVLKKVFDKGGVLHNLLLKYTHTLLIQISQSAACNRFHTVEERLCRWLLISRDRVHSDTIYLTQEFLSHMLGVPRTSVTTIAGKLQRVGLIRYSRGKIQITDRPRMEAASCECYDIIREDIRLFLAA